MFEYNCPISLGYQLERGGHGKAKTETWRETEKQRQRWRWRQRQRYSLIDWLVDDWLLECCAVRMWVPQYFLSLLEIPLRCKREGCIQLDFNSLWGMRSVEGFQNWDVSLTQEYLLDRLLKTGSCHLLLFLGRCTQLQQVPTWQPELLRSFLHEEPHMHFGALCLPAHGQFPAGNCV